MSREVCSTEYARNRVRQHRFDTLLLVFSLRVDCQPKNYLFRSRLGKHFEADEWECPGGAAEGYQGSQSAGSPARSDISSEGRLLETVELCAKVVRHAGSSEMQSR